MFSTNIPSNNIKINKSMIIEKYVLLAKRKSKLKIL
jgi:hypothetical protein